MGPLRLPSCTQGGVGTVANHCSMPPLCRDDLPGDSGADNASGDAAALQAIMADTTPDEQAEGFKVRAAIVTSTA